VFVLLGLGLADASEGAVCAPDEETAPPDEGPSGVQATSIEPPTTNAARAVSTFFRARRLLEDIVAHPHDESVSIIG
jgi:hypothetical protein